MAEKKLSQKDIKRALASIKPPKKKPTLPKAPWDDKEQKEAKVDEISMSKMQAYGKAAAKDIEKHRNTVKGALDQPASPKKAQAGLDAMKKLTKRSKGSDMYVDKMTGRSKVKPTAEETISELDKKTLGSYIKKAGPDREKQKAQAARHDAAGMDADKDADMYKHYGKAQRAMDKAANRSKYISKAVDKLTKEEAELDEISNAKMGQYVRKAADDAARKASKGDVVGARQRVKGVNKAMDKMDKNRLFGRQ